MQESRKKGKTTKKRGRPSLGGRQDPTSVTLRMPRETRERIEKFAAEKGVTLSKAILCVLDKHLPA